MGNLFTAHNLFHQRILNGTSWHSHGTFHNNNIFLGRLNICLFIAYIRIAFLCGDKSGGCLNSVCSQRKCMGCRLSAVNPPGKGCGNLETICLFIFSHNRQNFFDFCVIGGQVFFQLLPGKSQMSSCTGSFNYQKIRHPFIFSVPVFENYFCRLRSRYNGCQLHFCIPGNSRQFCGEPCSGDDEICPCLHSRPYIIIVIFHGDHNVKADHTLRRNGTGFCIFCPDRPQIGLFRIPVKIRLPVTDLSSGNNSNTAFFRNCPCKTAQADSYPHTALYNRKLCFYISHSQWLNLHTFSPTYPGTCHTCAVPADLHPYRHIGPGILPSVLPTGL